MINHVRDQESVLLYGSDTWTITKQIEKSIDGCYTRMLRMALNVSWRQHLTNEELYGNLPKISDKIREKRLRLAGHCVRHPEEEASKLIIWETQEGKRRRGRRQVTYIDNIKADTGLETTDEVFTAMKDQKVWRAIVNLARGKSPAKLEKTEL